MIIIESYISGHRQSWCVRQKVVTAQKLFGILQQREGPASDVVLQCRGRVLSPSSQVCDNATVVATLRLPGGKGGFGSMLRAIGAQIEKTTNREACRDLSGRRLRDINEEKRLKDFISKKAEREREMQEKKKQKFEKLKETPKHVFQDESYYKQRELREKNLFDSLDKAYATKNGSGPSGVKRDSSEMTAQPKAKIKKGRFMDDLDDSSEDDSDSECEETKPDISSSDGEGKKKGDGQNEVEEVEAQEDVRCRQTKESSLKDEDKPGIKNYSASGSDSS